MGMNCSIDQYKNFRTPFRTPHSKSLSNRNPLSPFLFTLVVDGLSRLMDRSTEVGFVKAWRVGRGNVMVSHLQFADDSIFFLDREEGSFKNLLIVLGLFCSTSGLKINMGKSTILGIGIDEVVISSMAELVGCEMGA